MVVDTKRNKQEETQQEQEQEQEQDQDRHNHHNQNHNRRHNHIPIMVLVEHIMPFLDRKTWNSCTYTCREAYELSKRSRHLPVWPQRKILQEGVHALAFSPDGMYLAVGIHFSSRQGEIHIYHVRYGRMKKLIANHVQLDLLEWPDEGRLICTDFNTIQVWDMIDFEMMNCWDTHAFRCIAAETDRLAVGHCDGQISIWSLPDGNRLLALHRHTCVVKSLKFVPDNSLVSVCNGDMICVWDLEKGDARQDDDSNPTCTELITYSLPVGITPKGTHAAIASVERSVNCSATRVDVIEEMVIWLWELNGTESQIDKAKPCVSHFNGHALPITYTAFSKDGSKMASCSFDKSIRIWDLFTGNCLAVLDEHEHHALFAQFTQDMKTLVSRSYDEFRIWNIK